MIYPTNVDKLPTPKFVVTVYRKPEFSDAQVIDADDSGFVQDADVFYVRKGTASWFYPMSTVSNIKVDRKVDG